MFDPSAEKCSHSDQDSVRSKFRRGSEYSVEIAFGACMEEMKRYTKLMADTLRALGFTLVGGGAQINLDKAGFDNAIARFGTQVVGADVGLFYYAGHGVQVRNSNYLVPVGANPAREADVYVQMVDIAVVLSQMEGSGTKLNLVILDACRNNPFGGRGLRATDPGLAQMRAPEGTLISYATQPGNVARDGTDSNSPYTKALAQTIRRAGLDIFQTFNEVGLTVKRATGGEQQPWVSNSPIDGNFYFAGLPVAAPKGAMAPAQLAPAGEAAQAWTVMKDTTSQAVLEDFIRQFGTTVYGSMARARLEELKKSQVAVVVSPVPPSSPTDTTPKPAVGVFAPGSGGAPLSVERERALKPKDSFKECEHCPEMVVVPAGWFTMGSPDDEAGRSKDEGPQHRVTFTRPFAVGRFAVTFAEWDTCVADGGCDGHNPSDNGWGRGKQPAINVLWDDAKAYAVWLSRKTGKTYRLLSEAEREYVTRAGTTLPFWGAPPSPRKKPTIMALILIEAGRLARIDSGLCQWIRFSPIRGDSFRCTATYGSGRKIATKTAIRAHQPTAPLRPAATVVTASFAAGLGTTVLGSSDRPPVAGAPQTSASSLKDFGWPERLRLES